MSDNMNNNINDNVNNDIGSNINSNIENNQVKKTLEETIGKNIMGVLASILIFAGLTLFATAVNDYISDAVKMLVILVVSVALFVVGLIGKQKKHNPFFMSLAGCGIGAIFISIFLAYGYFHLIGMPFLYASLAIWSIVVAIIGGEDAVLFRIIGQLGIIASLIFGVTQLSGTSGDERVIWTSILIIFFIIISVIYLAIDHRSGQVSYKVELVTDLGATICLYAAASGIEDSAVLKFVLFLVVCIYSIALVAVFSRKFADRYTSSSDRDLYVLGAEIINLISVLVFRGSTSVNNWIYGIVGLVFVIVMLILNELADIKETSRSTVPILMYLPAVILCYCLGYASKIIGAGLLVVPYLLFAYKRKMKTYMYMAVISTGIFAFINSFYSNDYIWTYLLFSLVFIVADYFVVILRKEDLYDSFLKIIMYLVVNCALIVCCFNIGDIAGMSEGNIDRTIFVASALLCFACIISPYRKDWRDLSKRDDLTWVFLLIVNVILGLNAIPQLNANAGAAYHVLVVIIFGLILSVNVKPMAEKLENTAGVCIYNCLKLTVFVFFTLTSYDAVGYLVSAALLVEAIGCIIFGFAYKYKPVRLYGLVLSIVSIGKIVLFDLDYNSNIIRAITIFVCGIIAFAICLVYNVLDKRLGPSEDKTVVNKTEPKQPGPAPVPLTQTPYNISTAMPAPKNVEPQMQSQPQPQMQPQVEPQMQPGAQPQMQPQAQTQPQAPVPLYFVQYVVPDQNGRPITQMIPVYPGQAMMPVQRIDQTNR